MALLLSDAKIILFNCSPSLTLLERGNKKGVSKKERGDVKVVLFKSCFIQLFPLSNSFKEGE
jgi:hypothetical protein